MKREEFKSLVKIILSEVKKSKKSTDSEKIDKDHINQEEDKYVDDVDVDQSETADKLVSSIKTLVNKIDRKINVFKNQHGNIIVRNEGVFSIRVNVKWAGMFDVEAYRNLSDRIYAVGLTYDQVLNFIKVNFVADKKSYVQTAYDKSLDNLKDRGEKKDKDLPKTEPVQERDVEKKDVEQEVTKKTDQPDAQMTPVKEKDIKRQEDHPVEKNKEMPKIQKMIKKN